MSCRRKPIIEWESKQINHFREHKIRCKKYNVSKGNWGRRECLPHVYQHVAHMKKPGIKWEKGRFHQNGLGTFCEIEWRLSMTDRIMEIEVSYEKNIKSELGRGQILKGLIRHVKEVIFYLTYLLLSEQWKPLEQYWQECSMLWFAFENFYSCGCGKNYAMSFIRVKISLIVTSPLYVFEMLKFERKKKKNQCSFKVPSTDCKMYSNFRGVEVWKNVHLRIHEIHNWLTRV